MSKASLKKELEQLDRQQLVEIILDAYSATKECKEYFEFFLNPDADALYDKKIELIAKEINRTKRGMCKARISVIRKEIKAYASFGVDAEHVGKLMLGTLRMLIGQNRWYYYSDALSNGIFKLAGEYLELADENGFVSTALENLAAIYNFDELGTKQVRYRLRLQVENSAPNLALKLKRK